MSLIPVYRDIILALEAARQGSPLWPAFHNIAYRPHRRFFDGLTETYGQELFGPAGLPGIVAATAPDLHRALLPAPSYRMEERVEAMLHRLRRHLPGRLPDVYIATLFFIAPAATISIGGRPSVALGLERFKLHPPAEEPKTWYHPDEVAEMIPHEAAHAVRMEALGLPPTPQRLTLLEMVMLEGTALLFTDLLLGTGKESLATFMPRSQLEWHKANDAQVLAWIAREFPAVGMPVFRRYFSVDSPISGYYAGYSLCRKYLERYGAGAMAELLCLPSYEALRRLG